MKVRLKQYPQGQTLTAHPYVYMQYSKSQIGYQLQVNPQHLDIVESGSFIPFF